LQGVWLFVSGKREAELLVCGRRWTVRFRDGVIYMGVFELGPVGLPKTMQMHIDEGPAQHRGKSALCIYELDGNTLRWCTAGPGQTERPATFPAEDHPQYLSLVFQRELR
jgi:uncharacterized protein (TIGR03067 family)